MAEFSKLTSIEPLRRALSEAGYTEMTAIQEASLPAILSRRGVTAQARTGSTAVGEIKGRTFRIRKVG